MAFLVGTDEAGYGPNLGPLVISASVWQIRDASDGPEPAAALEAAIRSVPVPMADSKILYRPGQGLRRLEEGLWAAWWAERETVPDTFSAVWQRLAGASAAGRHAALCDACDRQPAPLDADPAEVRRLGPALADALARCGARLLTLRSLAIFPDEFNQAVDHYGSKGEALSRWTLGLVAGALSGLPDEPIWVFCDKHGGRDHYLPLLTDFFPGEFIEARVEGRRASVYRLGSSERRVEIGFLAGGESHRPAALASMASKYLRELAMRALNAFWSARIPGLPPTAGYPQDARRFRSQIAGVQRELGIEDRVLWRVK
jgi:hypothetical protein